ncbi:alpha-L-fucosidase [Pedobacter westerhofensis]|uniref:alpha-L-fucosidase n=1 Tax=Pedobacter westerhofensis TaxID=425512 RepID=A0A521FR48_9SPHI|nr:alpha-L-fucosidase [Pedobacter westerhofensis]SMO98687.1 alpha-L-fucosidase [Pedobacter westerhofensis]
MNKFNQKSIIATLAFCLLSLISYGQNSSFTPKPYGAIPSARQLKWHETEMYCMVCFAPITFTGEERGYGDADPNVFKPTNFDALQIVKAAKSGGFKGIVYVAKHHDGFAMWPSKVSKYNISASSWKNGKGDIMREFQLATKKEGLKLGVYCSPWDRNNLNYGTPAYVEDYRNELKELYSNYGPLFMSWHDGANGGDGYYGGRKEERKVDPATYYDWLNTWKITRKMQPDAAIFSDAGLDVRWVGNEEGFAKETCWSTIDLKSTDDRPAMPGFINTSNLGSGTRNGKKWIPFEADVPLRPNWFYHSRDDDKVKSVEKLFEIYCTSVGRGGGMDLGLSPNREGLLHQNDVKVLAEFGRLLKQVFAVNLAKKAKISVSDLRNKNQKFGVANLTDADRYSYWATNDNVHTATIDLEFTKPTEFTILQLRENIKLGQRIDSIKVDIYKDKKWEKLTSATSIGANRIIRFADHQTAEKLRIQIYAPVSITVSDLGLYLEPKK